ncbi:hypothetical protein GOP47_0023808 [Adiantum capillus-veneris]|uniref:Secreted protein n=1 Tax=Adiantum capillus-veneris TaxID=13818 RepID=A0A9D4U4E6_ADICA|nr:hypothetical protein GOP47_0023808 [Adiantum capillus-veneris]
MHLLQIWMLIRILDMLAAHHPRLHPGHRESIAILLRVMTVGLGGVEWDENEIDWVAKENGLISFTHGRCSNSVVLMD